MIEIKCTEAEREVLLNIFNENNKCPFDHDCTICSNYDTCDSCLDENIDWDISDTNEKKKYRVNVEELLNRVIEVEAEDDEEAENIVRRMYDNGEIVLDASDFQSVEYFVC